MTQPVKPIVQASASTPITHSSCARTTLIAVGIILKRYYESVVDTGNSHIKYEKSPDTDYDKIVENGAIILHCANKEIVSGLDQFLLDLKPSKLILDGACILKGPTDDAMHTTGQWLHPDRQSSAIDPKYTTKILQIPVDSVETALSHNPGMNPETKEPWSAVYVICRTRRLTCQLQTELEDALNAMKGRLDIKALELNLSGSAKNWFEAQRFTLTTLRQAYNLPFLRELSTYQALSQS